MKKSKQKRKETDQVIPIKEQNHCQTREVLSDERKKQEKNAIKTQKIQEKRQQKHTHKNKDTRKNAVNNTTKHNNQASSKTYY